MRAVEPEGQDVETTLIANRSVRAITCTSSMASATGVNLDGRVVGNGIHPRSILDDVFHEFEGVLNYLISAQ